GIWALIESAISNGIDWPDWWAPYRRDVRRYIASLDGAPFLVDVPFTSLKARKAEEWRRFEICRKLQLVSCEEVQLPAFYEAIECVPAEAVYKDLQRLSSDLRAIFVIKCFPRQQVFSATTCQFTESQLDELRSTGFVVSGDEIPPTALIDIAPHTALKSILKLWGEKPSQSKILDQVRVRRLLMDGAHLEDSLRTILNPSELYCCLPPARLSWHHLQAYRWQIRGIIGMLFDLGECSISTEQWF